SVLEPTVIIAEGSTDILILKRSLQRLYPYLTDYITFFDYEGWNPDGGASYVVKFLRAFAAARINTPILAVFDNDAAGLEAFNAARALSLPQVSAEGRTVWVLIRRLNSSCKRSIAFDVRIDFHWLLGNRVKVKSLSPASSRLAATAWHFTRHLRMNALRFASISGFEAA